MIKSITVACKAMNTKATMNNFADMKYHQKKMSRIPEITNLHATVKERSSAFLWLPFTAATLRFNAMINATQQRTFSRLCC